MMDGMLSGKTGFTGKAGYCYVGALTKGEKSFTIALLACGWPNNRTWKWHDARLLLEYGLEAFDQRSLQQPDLPKTLLVENGQLAKVSLNCPKKGNSDAAFQRRSDGCAREPARTVDCPGRKRRTGRDGELSGKWRDL